MSDSTQVWFCIQEKEQLNTFSDNKDKVVEELEEFSNLRLPLLSAEQLRHSSARVKQYLWAFKVARWRTACFQWALAFSSALPRHWMGPVVCLALCVAIGDSRPGPGASPLWHTFSAAPPAWLSLLSKGGWCTFKKKKQTNMEAVGVQAYRPCSFESLWVRRLSICDIVGMRCGLIFTRISASKSQRVHMKDGVYVWKFTQS